MSDCSRTFEDLKALLKTCKDFDSQQRVKFYDAWSETYDQDYKTLEYRAPHLTVQFLSDNIPLNPEEVHVLDVACGSGLVAKLMVELGFKHFAGVDGSDGMLGKAAEYGLYQDLKQALLGPEPLPFQSDSFDVVIIVGGLRHNFVPVSVIRELCNVAKPGGYICMSRNGLKLESTNTYKESMEKELQLMEEEGLWTHVISKEMEKYIKQIYKTDGEDQENEGYSGGTMYLYRKTLN